MPAPRGGTLALRKSRLVRRRFRQIFYLVGFMLASGAIGHASYGFLTTAQVFNVRPPKIEGVSYNLTQEIQGLVDTLTLPSKNIFAINTSELEEQISHHPRIRRITVDKIYPDQLVIKASERSQAAILVTGGGFYLVDNDGYAMEKLSTSQLATKRLPLITGLRSEEVYEGEPVNNSTLGKALNLLQVLQVRNPEFYNHISDINIAPEGASQLENLTISTKEPLTIRFGDTNPVGRFAELETLMTYLQNQGVDPYNDLVYIDMRFKGQAVYMKLETAQLIAQGEYGKVQAELEQTQEELIRQYEKNSKSSRPKSDSDSSSRRATSTGSSSRSTSNRSSSGNTRNSQQNPQLNTPQHYNQPNRSYPTPQYPPIYNMPGNQPR